MVTSTNRPDIGDYRKIRLKPNAKGYYEIWWTDAAAGYLTRRQSTATKDPAEAQRYFDAFCADARGQAQAIAAGKPATVDELCRAWLGFAAAQGKDLVGGRALAAIRRELGHYTAPELDGVILQDYALGRRRSPGTIRRELGALRTVLIWAGDQRRISRDDVPVFKGVIPPSGPPRLRFLDATQEPRFWAEAQRWPDTQTNPRDRVAAQRVALFVALGLDTAARREAIIELTWDRVDLAAGTIDFHLPGRRLTKKRRVRGVRIAKRLMPILKEAWLRAPKDPGGQAIGRVVGYTNPDSLARPFARFAADVGLPWVTPHVLRHTWGSLRAMEGHSLYDIAQAMGDTVATIEAIYLHLSPDHLRAVFKA
jgi:integrase